MAPLKSESGVPRPLWPGLESYAEQDAGRFFGREQETADLLARVERRICTVLFAQSGVGKTSLLRAGLFPALRERGLLPVYIRLDHGQQAPPPLAQVWELLHDSNLLGFDPSVREPSFTLWEWCHDREAGLLSPRSSGTVPVFVFDQFEEFFTIGARDPERRESLSRFLDQLSDLVENRMPIAFQERIENEENFPMDRYALDEDPFRVLIALREDYLSLLDRERGRMPSVMQNRMLLDCLNGEGALKVVEGPKSDIIPSGIGEKIVRYVAGEEELPLKELFVEPALLSLLCRQLDAARGDGAITEELLSGRREEILQAFYEDCFAGLPPGARRYVEEKLVTDGGYRESLSVAGVEKEIGQAALDTLVSKRLLHTELQGRLAKVELTHDVLAPLVVRSRAAAREREAKEEAGRVEKKTLELLAIEKTKRLQLAWGLTAAVVLFMLAAGGLIGTFLLGGQTGRLNANLAEKNLALEVEKKNAIAAKHQAERAYKEVLDRASNLVEQATLESGGLGSRTRLALLGQSRDLYQSLRGLIENPEPGFEDDLSRRLLEIRLGEADVHLSNFALEETLAVLEIVETDAGTMPEEKARPILLKAREIKGDIFIQEARMLDSRAETAREWGQPFEDDRARAQKNFQLALAAYQSAIALETQDPWQQILIRNKTGDTLRKMQDWALAEAAIAQSFQDLDSLAKTSGNDPEFLSTQADTYNKFGNLHLTRNRKKAKEAYEKAAAIRKQLLEAEPDGVERKYQLAFTLANLADASAADDSEARDFQIYRERVELARQIYEVNPENQFYKRFYTDGLWTLARKFAGKKKPTAEDRQKFLDHAMKAAKLDEYRSDEYLETYHRALIVNRREAEAAALAMLFPEIKKNEKRTPR